MMNRFLFGAALVIAAFGAAGVVDTAFASQISQNVVSTLNAPIVSLGNGRFSLEGSYVSLIQKGPHKGRGDYPYVVASCGSWQQSDVIFSAIIVNDPNNFWS